MNEVSVGRVISKSGRIRALGAMSGTSMDGVDAAILDTDGHQIFGFGKSDYRAYSDEERATLRDALGHWQGPEVKAAGELVTVAHAEVLSEFDGVDLIGFHGQTLAHEPGGRGTLQVGDGQWLSQALGKPVVWDFRSDDVAMGGEGAPLAPFFHFACAKWIGADEPLCFLNLGGVGNLTYVDPSFDSPETPGALLAFDTGPANAPVDDVMQSRFGLPMDRDGEVARGGEADMGALERFLAEPFFTRIPPKSLDRNEFAQMITLVDGLKDADAVATLTAMCAAGVVQGMEHCPKPPTCVLVTGGGRHNPVLMDMLRAALDCPVEPVEAVELDGDMLEAQAFAHLAVRVARGLPTTCPGTTGVKVLIGGGTVSAPVIAKNLM